LSLTDAIARTLRWAHRSGRPRFVGRWSEKELDSYAAGIARLLGARLWLLRTRAARWNRIHRAWHGSLGPGAVAVRNQLSGRLDAEDRLELLTDARAVPLVNAAIYRAAHHTIDIATYYLQSDEAGWGSARELGAAVQRGVRVRLIADRQMTARKRLEIEGMGELFEFLKRAGVLVQLWTDAARPFDSNHRKMVLVDGETAIVGSRNFANHYQDGSWRDIDLLMRGPSARRLSAVFDATWNWSSRRAPAFTPWFAHAPALVDEDPTARFALACIATAERTIDAELAYFLGSTPFCPALAEAARRGVRVRLLTNSVESTDLPHASRNTYVGVRHLLDAGVTVHFRRGKGRTLHCKYMVADEEWVSLGSHNLNHYSSRFCSELNLHVHSASLGRSLTAFFETGLADTTPADRAADIEPFLAQARDLASLGWVLRDFM